MTEPRFATRPPDDPTYHVDPGRGWVLFAGVVLALAGVLNVVYAIAAIGNSRFFARDAGYVFGNLHTWAWLLLVIGVVQMIVAVGIWAATEWGRWLGLLSATANLLIQFVAFPARPGLALAMFMLDVLVIYGLLTYGGLDRHNLGD